MELSVTAFAVASLVLTTTFKNLQDWLRLSHLVKH